MANTNTISPPPVHLGENLDLGGDQPREKLRERAAALRERAGQALEQGRERVRESPVASLAIAAGVGVIVGLLIGRRRV
jgi:ElaB/YqjD/DUF883 family membrane-anchored ribosome-binding protein